MGKWRRYVARTKTLVFCDQLADAGLWPFRRFPWKPDLTERGYQQLRMMTAFGSIAIIPLPHVRDSEFFVRTLTGSFPHLAEVVSEWRGAGDPVPMGRSAVRVTPRGVEEALHREASLGRQPVLVEVSPRGWAQLNSDMAAMRRFESPPPIYVGG